MSFFALLVELIALMGAYCTLAELFRASGSERLPELSGSAHRRPFESAFFALFLLTLVGVPPAPGFFAKVGVISELMSSHGAGGGGWWLAVALLVSMLLAHLSALGALLSLLGDSRETVTPRREWGIPIVLYLAAPLIAMMTCPRPWIALGEQAMRLLFR
jgi:NADH:ubiquinone oxidoreductase subunit 2 (subunit N)